jgi:choline dehydrogenase-like flavoprotein
MDDLRHLTPIAHPPAAGDGGARETEHWDVVVIGTGFGGAMSALELARSGKRVLLFERGGWVQRDTGATHAQVVLVERKYRAGSPYLVGGRRPVFPDAAVGGLSIFYGAASLRLRESDFRMRSLSSRRAAAAGKHVDWPFSYAELEPFYAEAEQLLGVAGADGDPTGPPRSSAYPALPAPWATPARLLAQGAERLGLHPFALPLAINFANGNGRAACRRCATCDLLPCRFAAKNDLSVTVLPLAQRLGAEIRPHTSARRLVLERGRVIGVECLDTRSGRTSLVRCDVCVVSAGALDTPALLLRSGLGDAGHNGRLIGRYLVRHCNGIAVGFLPGRVNPGREFAKQVAITDHYHGPAGSGPGDSPEPWGVIQSLVAPPLEYLHSQVPALLRPLATAAAPYALLALCIAHEQPRAANRVRLHPHRRDAFDLPATVVEHRYSRVDLRARAALYRAAGRILRHSGAGVRLRKPIDTFSHALGTCRFGNDPREAVLDPWGNFFGVRNLFVADGSMFPSAGAVNPSLTIAACALRVGRHVAAAWDDITGGAA